MTANPPCPACHGETSRLYDSDLPGKPGFYQCGSDGFCFVDPEPTAEQLQAYYAGQYSGNEYWFQKNRKNAADYWRKLRPHLPAGKFRFLEVGGAFGFLAKLVQNNTEAEVVMIEIGDAAARFAQEELGVHTERYMLEDYFTEEGYDVIFAAHLIEHVIHLEDFLRHCARLMNPGGKLIFLTPNARAWKFELLRRDWAWAAAEQHTLFFSAAAATKILGQAGLRPVLVKSTVPAAANYPLLLVPILSKLFTRWFGRAPTASSFSSAPPQPAPAEAGAARGSKLARLRPLGRPLLWLEYAFFSVFDRLVGGGAKCDELLIIATPIASANPVDRHSNAPSARAATEASENR